MDVLLSFLPFWRINMNSAVLYMLIIFQPTAPNGMWGEQAAVLGGLSQAECYAELLEIASSDALKNHKGICVKRGDDGIDLLYHNATLEEHDL